MNKRYCGKCHTCGNDLRQVLDGEEFCYRCVKFRRYVSHGFSRLGAGLDEMDLYCPPGLADPAAHALETESIR